MKKYLLMIIVFLFINNILLAQTEKPKGKEKLPDSWINVSGGLGMSYGGIGTKTIIGERNSGLLLGLGVMPHTIGYEIGGQLSFNWFYINAGYGILGVYRINDEPYKKIDTFNFNIGGMINIGKERRMFIDVGVGFTYGAPKIITRDELDDFTTALGFGYRFGTRKKSIKDKKEG